MWMSACCKSSCAAPWRGTELSGGGKYGATWAARHGRILARLLKLSLDRRGSRIHRRFDCKVRGKRITKTPPLTSARQRGEGRRGALSRRHRIGGGFRCS